MLSPIAVLLSGGPMGIVVFEVHSRNVMAKRGLERGECVTLCEGAGGALDFNTQPGRDVKVGAGGGVLGR
jgi:hypothetical protein